MMKNNIFELEMKVRDYECDSQGIVNNANYLHYMENTRHEFLESLGVSFIELQKKHIDPVVVRVDIRYNTSLTGSEVFVSKLNYTKEGAKLVFFQEIYRKKDNKLCVKAKVDVVIMENGKLTRGDYFNELLNMEKTG